MLKKKETVLFSSLLSLVALLLGGALTLVSFFNDDDTVFPSYDYDDYIDKTSSFTFEKDDGGQLFEAEAMDYTSGISIIDDVGASGKECLLVEEKGASFSFVVNSLDEEETSIVMGASYVSEQGMDELSSSLFEVRFDNNPIALEGDILHSYNALDFHQNELFSYSFHKGINRIDVFCLEASLRIDYLALIPKSPRNSLKPTISAHTFPFSPYHSSQDYQGENFKMNHALILPDETPSFHCAYLFSSSSSIEGTFQSALSSHSRASIRYRSEAEAEAILKLGEQELRLSLPYFSSFATFDCGAFDILEGDNPFSLLAVSGALYIDKITLNDGINHSLESFCERFEIEDFAFYGESSIEESPSSSGGKSAGNIHRGDFFEKEISSPYSDDVFLTLSLSHWEEESPLSDLMEITLNGRSLDLNGIAVAKGDGYFDFDEVYLGEIHLEQGNNLLSVASKDDDAFNLDYLTLNHHVKDHSKIEAENLALLFGCQIESNASASSSFSVSYNDPGTMVALNLYEPSPSRKNLSIALALNLLELEKASNVLEIYCNDEKVDLTQVYLLPTASWRKYRLNENVATLSLSKGLNCIRILSLKTVYNLDYISLL